MLSAYISHTDCLKHEMGSDHPECPERLHAIADMLLVKGLRDFMVPYDAPLASEEQLGRAHSALYVRELLDRVPTEGYARLDPDTVMNPHTMQAALRSAGAAVLATDLAEGREAAIQQLDARLANVMAFEKWKATTPLKPSALIEQAAGFLGKLRYAR